MGKYKIIASDLDGTLFNDSSDVSRQNLAAIKEIDEKGAYFVPSTGRTFSDIQKILTENENIRYFICSNGAFVYDKKTGESITNGISAELLSRMLEVLSRFDVHVTVRTGGVSVVDTKRCTEHDFEFYNICEAHVNVLREFSKTRDDFDAWLGTLESVEAVATFYRSVDDLLECKKQLEALGGLLVLRQYEYNLDICSSYTSKGDALLRLADKLCVDREETIAVGDSENDSAMVKAAGLGLAVSNALDSLKSVADEVICSNEEHAIDYIVKKYL